MEAIVYTTKGGSTMDAIKNIIEEFSLSNEEAEKYMELYW